MAAGHYVNGVCTDTALSTDSYYSQIMPAFTPGPNGTEIYKVFANVNGTWTLDEYTISSTGTITPNFKSSLPIPSLASCTYQPELSATERFGDGAILGWGVAAAMAAAWAIHVMRRGL